MTISKSWWATKLGSWITTECEHVYDRFEKPNTLKYRLKGLQVGKRCNENKHGQILIIIIELPVG